MNADYFETDIAGADYRLFLEMMLPAHHSFSLVWRDQLRFNERASIVRESLKKFETDHMRSQRWPGTRLLHGAGKATIVRYRSDERALPVLLGPGSLFSWLAPDFPEDLAFYDESGDCALATISHDQEAWVLSEGARDMLGTLVRLYSETVTPNGAAVIRGVE